MTINLIKTIGDEMFRDSATFLVDKGREKEFDNIMDDFNNEYKNRIKIYVRSFFTLCFNFVNIVIYPEEWER